MADVLIKGMEMPKSCGDCPFLYDHDACYLSGMWSEMQFMLLCFNGHTDEYKLGEFPFKEKRVDWCPLVEVPTHGRLIDGDELLNDVRKNSESYFADDFAHEWVDRQPTVIEASEGGEQDG